MSTASDTVPTSPSCPSRCCGAMRKMLPRTILILVYIAYLLVGGLVFTLIEEPRYEELIEEEELHEGDHNATIILGEEWTFGNAVLFCMTTISTIGYGHMIPHTGAGKVICIFYTMFGIPMTVLLLADLGHMYAIILMKGFNKCRARCCKARIRKRSHRMKDTRSKPTANCEREIPPRPPTSGSNGIDNATDAENNDQALDLTEASADPAGNGGTNGDLGVNNASNTQPDEGVELRLSADAKENDGNNDDDENSDDDGEDDPLADVPILLPPILFWSYIIMSAPMFSWMEGWPFLTSVYFLFISITTVGFGDLVPRSSMGLVSSWFGLIVVSICIVLSYRRFICGAKWLLAVLESKINPQRNDVHYSNI